jgi:hypothetical protein
MSSEAAKNDGYELVTVATFPEPAEANMARTVLEGAGIDVYLRGENANSMIPVAFETQLQVRPEDAAAARELLDDAEKTPVSVEAVTLAEMADEVK